MCLAHPHRHSQQDSAARHNLIQSAISGQSESLLRQARAEQRLPVRPAVPAYLLYLQLGSSPADNRPRYNRYKNLCNLTEMISF